MKSEIGRLCKVLRDRIFQLEGQQYCVKGEGNATPARQGWGGGNVLTAVSGQ